MDVSPEVAVLVDFLNTIDVETGAEDLADDAACARWFGARGLPAPPPPAAPARAVRDALRAAADGDTPSAAARAALATVPLHLDVVDGTPALTSTDALGTVLATVARLVHEGGWERVKLCDMHTCRYVFYDGSRNRSGRWCSMRVCGNRAKTRAFRERQR